MRLSTFIDQNLEAILREWEDFARSINTPGKALDPKALRDHAGDILCEISDDLQKHQSAQQQIDKSQGQGEPDNVESAAETHAVTRLLDGFTLDQMVSEYRALRASVLRLWMAEVKSGSDFEVDDITRFNESIDQALAESIASYSRAVEGSRTIFLGVLGHDLRSPLSAILLGAESLSRTEGLSEKAKRTSMLIQASATRATRIVGDLLDFTRSQLASGFPIEREEVDVSALCEHIVQEVQATHADSQIIYKSPPPTTGILDGGRLEQVLANLITNAVTHGDRTSPINVVLESNKDEIFFKVHNRGVPIPADAMPFVFNPLGRYSEHAGKDLGPNGGLGLGLYIASEIVTAHCGSIDVTSNEPDGTTFVVRLPRAAKQA